MLASGEPLQEMKRRKPRNYSAADLLLHNVERVEKLVVCAVRRGGSTATLVSAVTKMRLASDMLADYLFKTSKPAKGNVRLRMRPAPADCTATH